MKILYGVKKDGDIVHRTISDSVIGAVRKFYTEIAWRTDCKGCFEDFDKRGLKVVPVEVTEAKITKPPESGLDRSDPRG